MSGINTDNHSRVLITGGSGLIGRYLTSLLLEEGFSVAHLSRKQGHFGRVRVYRWDPEKLIIDPEALRGTDYIVHLSGENIGDSRWTKRRKEEILKSRVESAKLLHKVITEENIPVKAFVSASAIGYYGSDQSEKVIVEDMPPGNDFLATVCQKWEAAADYFSNTGIRTVKIRTGVALEMSGGVLQRIMNPARYGLMFFLGNGHQIIPWIHIRDLCGIYLHVIKNQDVSGAFNAVAPEIITHRQFMLSLASKMKHPVLKLHVPSVVVSSVLGQMSELVLKGNRISSAKIIEAGYRFGYHHLDEALDDLLINRSD